jgi:hypothetical protein
MSAIECANLIALNAPSTGRESSRPRASAPSMRLGLSPTSLDVVPRVSWSGLTADVDLDLCAAP